MSSSNSTHTENMVNEILALLLSEESTGEQYKLTNLPQPTSYVPTNGATDRPTLAMDQQLKAMCQGIDSFRFDEADIWGPYRAQSSQGISKAHREIERLMKENEKLRGQLKCETEAKKDLEDKVEDLKEDKLGLESDLEKLEGYYMKVRAQDPKVLKSEIRVLERSLAREAESKKRVQVEVQYLRNSLNSMDLGWKFHEKQSLKTQESLKAEIESFKAFITSMSPSDTLLEGRVKFLEKSLDKAAEAKEELKVEIRKLEKKLEEEREDHEFEMEEELDKKDEEIRGLESEVEHLQDSLDSKVQGLQNTQSQESESLRQEVQALKKSLTSETRAKKVLEKRMEALRSTLEAKPTSQSCPAHKVPKRRITVADRLIQMKALQSE